MTLSPRCGTYALLTALFTSSTALAQIPSQCLEIESILVDACNPSTTCPGSSEGQNEMVRFRTGPNPIALGDLQVTWPNNSWHGLVQNATTADLTAALNATIQSCGRLLEPPGGVIPSGSGVLLVTNTAMCLAGNSFAALSDTLYLIFQGGNNSAGHFANSPAAGQPISTSPPSGNSTRTLVITHVPTGCSDTATYVRELLVNQEGTYGGPSTLNDGATVHFSWPGVPLVTYVNNGCQAPVEPFSVEAAVSGDLCGGGSVQLTGAITGTAQTLQWSGGTGAFADPNALSTTYTAGPGDAGTVTLTLCATGVCTDPVCSTVVVPVGDAPVVAITADGPLDLCSGATVVLTANGADTYVWSTTQPGPTITVNAPGIYAVTGTNACGSATAQVEITGGTPPMASISGNLLVCPDAGTLLTAAGGTSFLWNTGATTGSITVNAPGTYSVTVSNDCGSATAQATVIEGGIPAEFTAVPASGQAPLEVHFTGETVGAPATETWTFGDDSSFSGASPTHVFTEPGIYVVTHTINADGCTSQATMTITVNDIIEESFVKVPNIFSPNGDGRNDVLWVENSGLRTLDMTLFNRWGQQVAVLTAPHHVWNGRTGSGEEVPEGTYFYVLHATGLDSRSHDLRGTVTIVR
jgi:gliding motility-associated-like protein